MRKAMAYIWVFGVLFVGCLAPTWGKTTVTLYLTNAQGTPVVETDASGAVLSKMAYRPYGTQVLGAAEHGPGYTGHVNDPDTGLVYMQARYYDQSVGRFISSDAIAPLSGNIFNFNRYTYVNNNPILNFDPTGNQEAEPDGSEGHDSPEARAERARARYEKAKNEYENRQKNESRRERLGKLSSDPNANRDSSAGRIPSKEYVGPPGDSAPDPMTALRNGKGKGVGSYTITFESGNTYDGKVPIERALRSMREKEKTYGDKGVTVDWTPAENNREAFKQEARRMRESNAPRSENSYNKINSPREKMLQQVDE